MPFGDLTLFCSRHALNFHTIVQLERFTDLRFLGPVCLFSGLCGVFSPCLFLVL